MFFENCEGKTFLQALAVKGNRQVYVERLAELFKRANEAAIAADTDHTDGGTCNFDTPAFTIDRIREDVIQDAAKLAGITATKFHWKWMGGRWYWLHVTMHGQGQRRTTMMEAAQKVLDAFGEENPEFRSCGYMQAD